MGKKAVVLLSGGLDSTTTLYYAKKNGYTSYCLIFDYSQRHKKEITQAIKIAKLTNSEYKLIKFKLPWSKSSLTEIKKTLPLNRDVEEIKSQIPSTYVPARNTIFLSFAISYAESISADNIFIGANAIDFSGYPDCRPEFYIAFKKIVYLGTKKGIEGKGIQISAPLIRMTKAEIIKLGQKLNVPFELTWSCYKGGKKPCQKCDACILRAKGFAEAGIEDPILSKVYG